MIVGSTHNQSWFDRLLNSKKAMIVLLCIVLGLFLAIEWFVPSAGFLSLT